MRCPICETDNAAGSFECATCGRMLASHAEVVAEVAPLAGLEQTSLDPLDSGPDAVERVAGVEQTALARRELRVSEEGVPGVERTQSEPGSAACACGATGPCVQR